MAPNSHSSSLSVLDDVHEVEDEDARIRSNAYAIFFVFVFHLSRLTGWAGDDEVMSLHNPGKRRHKLVNMKQVSTECTCVHANVYFAILFRFEGAKIMDSYCASDLWTSSSSSC